MKRNLKLMNGSITLAMPAAGLLQVLVVLLAKASSIEQHETSSTNETTNKDVALASQLDNMVNVGHLRVPMASEHSPTIDTTAYLIKESPDPLNDQISQAMATGVGGDTHNQLGPAPNHKNYPSEPYPSASYNFLMTSAATPNSSIGGSPGGMTTTNSHQLATVSFLNRDHHQSNSISQSPIHQHKLQQQQQQQSREFSSNDNEASNAPGNNMQPNQNFAASISGENNQHGAIGRNAAEASGAGDATGWHNYAGNRGSSLNTALIQNLTAGLFPSKQLSNVTLLTLSELLNKSRPFSYQQMNNNNNNNNHQGFSTLEYKPTSYNLGHLSGGPLSALFGSSMQGSALDASLTPPLTRYDLANMVATDGGDRFRPSGFSLANSLSPDKLQTKAHQMQEDPLSNQASFRGFSGLLNPFTPPTAKDISLMNADPQSPFSVSLYNSYATEPTSSTDYQTLPSTITVNNLRQYLESKNLSPPSALNFAFAPPPVYGNNDNLALQANQNKLANQLQQQQLTPFKPSVVNPPQLTSQEAATNPPAKATISNQQQLGNLVFGGRGRVSMVDHSSSLKDTNNDKTFGSFALGSSNSETRPTLAGYQQQSGKTALRSNRPSDNHQMHRPILSDDFDPSTFNNVTAFHLMNSDRNPILASSPNRSETALLFDLYEREVDKQIRDALYGNQQQFLQESALSSASKNAASWFGDKTPSSDLYSDDGLNDLLGWPRPQSPSTAPSNGASFHPVMSNHAPAASTSAASNSWPATRDYLAAAVQDLPTFGGADFQPLIATTQSYSLFPFQPSYQESTDTSQLASVLASQLLAQEEPAPAPEVYKQPLKVVAPSKQSQNSPSSGSSTSSLPSFLMKLNSSPLSSVFSAPLSQLYASLNPLKGRYKKPQQQQQQQQHNHHQQQQQNSNNALYNQASAANSIVFHQPLSSQPSKNLLSSLTNPVNAAYRTAIKLRGQQHQQQMRHNHHNNQKANQQRLMMASLLAAAATSGVQPETTLSPFQAALLQAQLGNPNLSSYLASEAANTPTLSEVSSLFDQSSSSNAIAESTANDGSSNSGVSTTSAGSPFQHLPPLIWRNILAQTNWARKQSSAPLLATTQFGSNNQGTMQVSPSSSNSYQNAFHHLRPSLRLPSLESFNNKHSLAAASSLFNSNLANYLFNNNQHSNAVQKNQQQTTGNSFMATPRQQQPKLAIKILKIPVALYDSSNPTSNPSVTDLSQLASGPSASHFTSGPQMPAAISLAQLFTSHLNCPLHHPSMQPTTALLDSFSQHSHTQPIRQSHHHHHNQLSHQLQNSLGSTSFSSMVSPSSMSVSKQQSDANEILSGLTSTTTMPPLENNQQSSGILSPSTIASVIGSQISTSDLLQDPNSATADLQMSNSNLERKILEFFK